MNVNLKYVASSGNVYNLKGDGIRTRTANYHAWEWGVDGTVLQFGTRVAAFTRAAAIYETTLVFQGSYAVRKAIIDALHEDFERDVRSMKPGRIIWGDYYIDCYITVSSTAPDENNIYTENEIEIFCPYPFWIREETKEFAYVVSPEGQAFLDYPYDYSYDFWDGQNGQVQWVREFPFASEFTMTIFGAVDTPRIMINGHPYQINDVLEEGQYLVIDSRHNTVTKYLINGTTVNDFDLRDKTQSVFEQIPGDSLTITWDGTFGFNITIYEERSEPRQDDNRYGDLEGNDAILTVERW